jgi:hypothetical protein
MLHLTRQAIADIVLAVSGLDECNMNMEHWVDDTDRGKRKHSAQKNALPVSLRQPQIPYG